MNEKRLKEIAHKEYERDKDILNLGYKKAQREELEFLKDLYNRLRLSSDLGRDILFLKDRIKQISKDLGKKE